MNECVGLNLKTFVLRRSTGKPESSKEEKSNTTGEPKYQRQGAKEPEENGLKHVCKRESFEERLTSHSVAVLTRIVREWRTA